ncbi:MAG TPA: hypothetical protein PKD86_01150 [Gemmatales bacterium]|nr:hypothetical protein [Gemmatales bacterium]
MLFLLLPLSVGLTWGLGQDAASLAGTTWEATTSQGRQFTWTFHADKTLEYASPAGTYRNATWNQEGDKISFEMNNKYAQWTGTLKGDRMEGTGQNEAGAEWTWQAKRVGGKEPAPEPPAPTRPAPPPTRPRPAPPVRSTAPVAPPTGVDSLAGTTWEGKDSDGDSFSYRFLPGGILEYSAGGSTGEGTWKQDGAKATFETSNRYAEMTVTISGTTMAGSATNIEGRSWRFTARRVSGRDTLPNAAAPTQPAKPPPQADPSRLEGTTWRGVDSDGDEYTLRFLPDGALQADTPQGRKAQASWKITGDEVYFQFNNRYSEYRGRLRGDTMEGTAENVRGRTWTWRFRKVDTGKAEPTPAPPVERPPPAAPVVDLVDSRWRGTDSDGDEYQLTFLANGELKVVARGAELKQARWELTGDRILLDMNAGHSKYRGTIKGDLMEGTAENVSGRTWTWSFRRVRATPPAPPTTRPADPPAADRPRPKIELVGTTWSGVDSDGDRYVFRFLRDGVLDWTSPAGRFRDGKWQLEGDRVTITLNDGYSTYTATIKNDAMEGEAVNRVGRRWTWKMRRDEGE